MVKKLKEMSLNELQRECKKICRKLSPHFDGAPIINEVWKNYDEDNKIGKLLRGRDQINLMIYKIKNGNGL